MYHVTSASDIDAIQEEGIKSRGIPDYYSPRYEIDRVADKIGFERDTNWVARVDGVYFWNSKEQARANTQYTDLYDRIIEVDPSAIPSRIWMLPHDEWEALYQSLDRPSNIEQGTNAWEQIAEVVEMAEQYTGNSRGNVELWTSPPVPSSAITDIHEI